MKTEPMVNEGGRGIIRKALGQCKASQVTVPEKRQYRDS